MTRPIPDREVPEGFHLEAVVEQPRWQVGGTAGKRCRWTEGGNRCPNQAVARLDRNMWKRYPQWWCYCADHLFGRWIEDGRIMAWRLVKNDERVKSP